MKDSTRRLLGNFRNERERLANGKQRGNRKDPEDRFPSVWARLAERNERRRLRSGTSRQTVYAGTRPVGFVHQTAGGFFRGYSYVGGQGYGPFATERDAGQWVERMAQK